MSGLKYKIILNAFDKNVEMNNVIIELIKIKIKLLVVLIIQILIFEYPK